MRRPSCRLFIAVLTFLSLSAGASAAWPWAAVARAQRKPAPPKSALPTKNPVAASEDSIKAGRVLYAANCRPCHGLQGKGDGVAAPEGSKPANLVDAQWVHGSTDVEIFKTIKEGVGPAFDMEPWGDRLTDTDIWNVINLLRSLGPKDAKR